MRLQTSVALFSLLPSLAVAADQVPLREKVEGWLDKAKAYIPTNLPTPPNPVDAGAAKVAEAKVEKINVRNYERKLGPKLEGEEEWLIYLTGGNKSCFGRCEPADRVWNQSVPLLAALPRYADSTLKLGTINCDHESVLCTGWAASVPAVWHFIFPQKTTANPSPASPLHELKLNLSTIAVSDVTSIPRGSKSRYLEVEEYTGYLHPFDGQLAKLGLQKPFGYALWGFGSTPSWMIMIAISFFSRQYMGRRAGGRPGINGPMPGVGPTVPAAAIGTGGKKTK